MDMTTGWVLGVLACLLLGAAWTDIQFRRIPNGLILVGLILALLANGLLPKGHGYFHPYAPGALGWLNALYGFGLGMLFMLPLYWLRAMGAGDVKLMGMIGMFLGPVHVQGVLVFTFLAGGLLALGVALYSHKLASVMHNIKLIVMDWVLRLPVSGVPRVDAIAHSAVRLPYGVAIVTGTASYALYQHFNWLKVI